MFVSFLNTITYIFLLSFITGVIEEMDSPVEPISRYGVFSAAINSIFFLWGGSGASYDLSHVHMFDSPSGAWTAKQTTGTPPPGYYQGTSTSVGDIMYTFGGWDYNNKDTGCLYELNIKTLVWQLFSQKGPMKKKRCAMAAINDILVLFGGRTKSPGNTQSGSQCVKIDDYYYTNELHVYNLKTSECFSSEYILQVDLVVASYCSPLTLLYFEEFFCNHSYLYVELSSFSVNN